MICVHRRKQMGGHAPTLKHQPLISASKHSNLAGFIHDNTGSKVGNAVHFQKLHAGTCPKKTTSVLQNALVLTPL